jgi:hypothetical protein
MYSSNSCFYNVKIQSNNAKDYACKLLESRIIIRTIKNIALQESKLVSILKTRALRRSRRVEFYLFNVVLL